MRVKCIILLIHCFLAVLGLSAQELTVKEMKSTNDLSASQFRRKDLVGEACALVKVQLTAKEVGFEGNVIQPVEYKGGEYWVYMSKGSRELRIKHLAASPAFLPCHVSFADYGISGVEPLTTYELTLLMGEKTQKLIIDYTPTNAIVVVDSKPYQGNGHLELTLPVGTHDYQIVAMGYDTVEGSVKLNSSSPRTISEKLIATQQQATNLTLHPVNQQSTIQQPSDKKEGMTTVQMFRSGMDSDAVNGNSDREKGLLNITVTPSKSIVYIDGEQQNNKNGEISLNLLYGKHKYKVECQGYVTEEGIIRHTRELMQHTIKLVTDVEASKHRRELLNILENYRIALEEKNLANLEKIYSDDALIITGAVVARKSMDSDHVSLRPEIRYMKQGKEQYLSRLKNNNMDIKVKFNDISIVKHPAKDNFYGVTLRQEWHSSESYLDEGCVFLLWELPQKEGGQPRLHVRTWQPEKYQGQVLLDESEKFTCDDFIVR